MSGCHEPKCICNINISSIYNLIEHCQSGIEKCFEKIEEFETYKIWLDQYRKEIFRFNEEVSNRIEKLEKTEKNQEEYLKKIQYYQFADPIKVDKIFTEINEKIEKLEKHMLIRRIMDNNFVDLLNKINKMEESVKLLNDHILETRIQFINQLPQNEKPHKCPVCDGCGNDKGIVKNHPDFNFYAEYNSCHTCKGKGIVWK